jgi:hypothetical protein
MYWLNKQNVYDIKGSLQPKNVIMRKRNLGTLFRSKIFSLYLFCFPESDCGFGKQQFWVWYVTVVANICVVGFLESQKFNEKRFSEKTFRRPFFRLPKLHFGNITILGRRFGSDLIMCRSTNNTDLCVVVEHLITTGGNLI